MLYISFIFLALQFLFPALLEIYSHTCKPDDLDRKSVV